MKFLFLSSIMLTWLILLLFYVDYSLFIWKSEYAEEFCFDFIVFALKYKENDCVYYHNKSHPPLNIYSYQESQ